MNDYHHFNNPRLLKDHFEKLDKIAETVIVPGRRTTDYEGAVQKLSMLARLLGLKLHDLVEEAAEKVKEKYLNGL